MPGRWAAACACRMERDKGEGRDRRNCGTRDQRACCQAKAQARPEVPRLGRRRRGHGRSTNHGGNRQSC